MEAIAIVILVLVLAGFVVYMKFFRTGDKQDIVDELITLGIDANVLAKFKQNYTTPMGATVKSTVVVPQSVLALIDVGLDHQIRNSSRVFPAWTVYRRHSEYKILLIDPMGINVENTPGGPHLRVKGISTAGTCIGVNRFSDIPPHIVLPHQEGQAWQYTDYFMRSIWHESEHIAEWGNDKGIFYYWAHAGDQHPHYPDTEAARGLVSRNVVIPPCKLLVEKPKDVDIKTPPFV